MNQCPTLIPLRNEKTRYVKITFEFANFLLNVISILGETGKLILLISSAVLVDLWL